MQFTRPEDQAFRAWFTFCGVLRQTHKVVELYSFKFHLKTNSKNNNINLTNI